MREDVKPTLLVVDDDKRVLASLKMWFSNEGFEVFTANNGEDALRLINENTIDAALIDFKIGNEDGLYISKQIKEINDNIIIIILTGYPSYETAVQAMKIGVFDYLSKASPNEKIMSVVRKAIEEKERLIQEKPDVLTDDARLKLVLFCDHSLIKERLENFSRTNREFTLVMSFPSVDSFMVRSVSQEAHIALVCAGCNLKRFRDSYTVFPELYRRFPGIKTLIINENFSDQEKVDLLKLGVRGFSSQDSNSSKLEKALQHIARDELWVSRRVTQLSLKNMISYEPPPPVTDGDTYGLTRREEEILRKITEGMKNKEIGQLLTISEQTVKTHVNRIFKKLGVDSRTRAILTALEKKIV